MRRNLAAIAPAGTRAETTRFRPPSGDGQGLAVATTRETAHTCSDAAAAPPMHLSDTNRHARSRARPRAIPLPCASFR